MYISLYLYYFPLVIGNSFIFLSIILIYGVIIAYLSATVSKKTIHLILFNIMLFSFLISSTHTIQMEFPFLDDPYYYFTSVINILYTGSLTPILSTWHWIVSYLPYYPILHTWTASNLLIVGIIPSIESLKEATIFISFLNFLVPLFTYIFCKQITKNDNIALLSALVISSGFSFFQYHEQYMALTIYLVLFSILFRKEIQFRFLSITLFAALSISHRATVLILLFVFLTYFIIVVSANFRKNIRIDNINISILGITFMLTSLAIVHTAFLEGVINNIYFLSDSFAPYFLDKAVDDYSIKKSILLRMYDFFGYSKYLLFLASIAGLIYIFHKTEYRKKCFHYGVFYVSLLVLTILSGIIKMESMNRFLLFFYLFISFFSAVFIYKYLTKIGNRKKIMSIIVFGLLISSNAAYNIPIQFFDSEYSAIPPMNEYHHSGRWIYTNDNSNNYIVGVGLRHIVDYFGERPYSNVTVMPYNINSESVEYIPTNLLEDNTLVISDKFYGHYIGSTYKSLLVNTNTFYKYNYIYNSGEIYIAKSDI
jgi:hypothetical protein